MQMPVFERYIDGLIQKSTVEVPVWNIEKAKAGGKGAGWNYIDGCMILAMLEIYQTTGEKKYYEFADAFIDYRVNEDGTIKGYKPEDEREREVPQSHRIDLRSGSEPAQNSGRQFLA